MWCYENRLKQAQINPIWAEGNLNQERKKGRETKQTSHERKEKKTAPTLRANKQNHTKKPPKQTTRPHDRV